MSLIEARLWLAEALFLRGRWRELRSWLQQSDDVGRPERIWLDIHMSFHEGRDPWSIVPRLWPDVDAVRRGVRLGAWSHGGQVIARVPDVLTHWP